MKYLGYAVALVVVASASLLIAAFPRTYPRLINWWYSILGFKTRLAEDDYTRWSVRSTGIVFLAAEIGWVLYRFFIKS